MCGTAAATLTNPWLYRDAKLIRVAIVSGSGNGRTWLAKVEIPAFQKPSRSWSTSSWRGAKRAAKRVWSYRS
jgi:hypothetical protein